MSLTATLQVPTIGSIDVPTGLFMYVNVAVALRQGSFRADLRSDNEWCSASDNGVLSTVNPATEEKITAFAHATVADVDRAVASSRKAFETTWGTTVPSTKRAACTCWSIITVHVR